MGFKGIWEKNIDSSQLSQHAQAGLGCNLILQVLFCIQGVPKFVHHPENTFIVNDAQIEHNLSNKTLHCLEKAALNIP